MNIVGEIISRVRNLVKSSKQDAFLTDRFLYSLISKHARWLLKRQDATNKIMRYNALFQTLPFVELTEVDRIAAGCRGLHSGYTFMRTRETLPALMQGYYGPLIRAVTSLDQSETYQPTFPSTFEAYTNQGSFRYNKTKYYWFIDGHLYFPNMHHEAVRIEGVFEEDISRYNCDQGDDCRTRQQQQFPIPDYLLGELEAAVLKDLGMMMQVPTDGTEDNLHPIHP